MKPVVYTGIDLTAGTILTSPMENGFTINAGAHNRRDLGAKVRIFINDVEKEFRNYLKDYKTDSDAGRRLEDGSVSGVPYSIIYLPLMTQERVMGVITIQSYEKNVYTKYHLNLLQNLATYTTIAFDNADAYRKLNVTLENLKATQEKLVTQEKLASLGLQA